MNSIFRSEKYCDIPICDKEEKKLKYSERLVSCQPIDQKLDCGCFAFMNEYHQLSYSLSHFNKHVEMIEQEEKFKIYF